METAPFLKDENSKELKRVKKIAEMEKMCREALRQIEGKHYARVPAREGGSLILKYGTCPCRKSCMVKTGRDGP